MNAPWNDLGFGPADILLPQGIDLTKWSVVACDQYTSQPDYWQRVETLVGDSPSTLRLTLPERHLQDGRTQDHIAAIHAAMADYLSRGLLRTLADSLIFVERRLEGGALRRGLVGQVDLEQYSYLPDSASLIRPTEGTVVERIPPRLAVRRTALLELPHVMLLLDDPAQELIEHLSDETEEMEQVYDFDLMEDSGHITGYRLNQTQLEELGQALLERRRALGEGELLFAVGDGNHSLATAKAAYEEKKGTPEGEKARYALVEVVNLHDESLQFEPIHRVCFGVDYEPLRRALLDFCPGAYEGAGEGEYLTLVHGGERCTVTLPTASLAIVTLQAFLDDYLPKNQGKLDYIHGAAVVEQLCRQEGAVGFLLPELDKLALFDAIARDGVLPRKTFSMGRAQDKRFYLEGRTIR